MTAACLALQAAWQCAPIRSISHPLLLRASAHQHPCKPRACRSSIAWLSPISIMRSLFCSMRFCGTMSNNQQQREFGAAWRGRRT